MCPEVGDVYRVMPIPQPGVRLPFDWRLLPSSDHVYHFTYYQTISLAPSGARAARAEAVRGRVVTDRTPSAPSAPHRTTVQMMPALILQRRPSARVLPAPRRGANRRLCVRRSRPVARPGTACQRGWRPAWARYALRAQGQRPQAEWPYRTFTILQNLCARHTFTVLLQNPLTFTLPPPYALAWASSKFKNPALHPFDGSRLFWLLALQVRTFLRPGQLRLHLTPYYPGRW